MAPFVKCSVLDFGFHSLICTHEAVGKFVLTLSLHFLWPSFRTAHLAEPWGYKLWALLHQGCWGRICKLENAGHYGCFCLSPFQRQLPIGCNSRLEIFMARTWGRLWDVYSRYPWALLLMCGHRSYEGTCLCVCAVFCSALWILAISGHIRRRQKRRCFRVCGHGWDHYFPLVHRFSSVSGVRTAAGFLEPVTHFMSTQLIILKAVHTS